MRVWIRAAAVLGPGLPGWAASRPVLRGEAPWQEAAVALPPPPGLPATERRRTGAVVRLALAAAAEALAESGFAASALDSVFASSNGDGAVVGAILAALEEAEVAISPTQFHNSVHNAAVGYWGIAIGSTRPSVALGGFDAAFATGLMQAAAGVATSGRAALFCAYDAPMPVPLAAVRPTAFPFAAALVLVPEPAGAQAALSLGYVAEPAAEPALDGPLGALIASNPAARALPLLAALARGEAATLAFPLLEDAHLAVSVAPC